MLLGFILAAMPGIHRPALAAQATPPLRWAYWVPDDPSSLASLKARSGDLDYVGLHAATIRNDGTLDLRVPPDLPSLVRSLGARPILSVTLASGADTARALLSTDGSRAATVRTLTAALSPYDGISIDFEGLDPSQRPDLTRFMEQLSAALRPSGKLVTMALSAKSSDTTTGWAGAFDYAALAPNADLFILMAYGYRTARSSVPGPVAPFPWVTACLDFAASQIPPSKLLLGVPFYGYDWDTTTGPPAKALRYPEAAALAANTAAAIEHDPVQHAAHFSYVRDGHAHQVWFEDRASLEPKLALVSRKGLAGVAAWRLGHEDPQVWPTINALRKPSSPQTPNDPTASALDTADGGSWYFAEGSTAPPFDTWILIQNPNPSPVPARITLQPEGLPPITRQLLLPPTSRTSIYANQLLPNAAFSTRIDAPMRILAERAMYAGFDGHAVSAITSPSTVWYFADGATTPPFDTWILLQNPNPEPTTVHLTFYRESGSLATSDLSVGPYSRASVYVNQLLPNAAFSTRVDADKPVVAERAMYRSPGNAATCLTGLAAPSRTWFFAGGTPPAATDSWLLLQNPNSFPVTVEATLLGTDGRTAKLGLLLLPASRQSVLLGQFLPSPSFGMQVEADGPIVAERSVFIGPGQSSGGEPQGAYATRGSPSLATGWALAEGSTAPPFRERISILNPHAAPMQIHLELMLENGSLLTRDMTAQPSQVLDIDPSEIAGAASFSARVTTSLPSVVERTMFWEKGGKLGAHATTATPLQ